MLLAAAVPEAERIKLRLQHNVFRRNMQPEEIADDADQFMKLTQCTQEEAARELMLSPATDFQGAGDQTPRPARAQADGGAGPAIDRVHDRGLADAEAMRQAFEHASTPGRGGKLPTRDQMTPYLEQFRKKKPREARVETLRGTVEGRKVELGLLPGESTESVIEFLRRWPPKSANTATCRPTISASCSTADSFACAAAVPPLPGPATGHAGHFPN